MNTTRTTLVGLALMAFAVGGADVALAQSYYVDYLIRETPSDPESNVIYVISLGVTEDDHDGDWIGWNIDKLAIVKLDGSEKYEAHWIEDSPTVSTPDGLWWVLHDDVSNPLAKEFDVTPFLSGTATANDPYDDDMEYDFGGATFTGQSPTYGGNVSSATYTLMLEGNQEPEAEGEDEPVEVDELLTEPSY